MFEVFRTECIRSHIDQKSVYSDSLDLAVVEDESLGHGDTSGVGDVDEAGWAALDGDGGAGHVILGGGENSVAEDAGAGDGESVASADATAGGAHSSGHHDLASDFEGGGSEPGSGHALVLPDADLHVLSGQLLGGGAPGVVAPHLADVLGHVLGAVTGGLEGAVASNLADLDL